jgi:hypothetical protein
MATKYCSYHGLVEDIWVSLASFFSAWTQKKVFELKKVL